MAFSTDTTWTFNLATGYAFNGAESEFTGGYWHAKAAFTGETTCETPTIDVSTWAFIDRIEIDLTEAVDYYHRFLVSFDDGVVWRSYGPGGWYPVPVADIGTFGMSAAQLIGAVREFPTPDLLAILAAVKKDDVGADGALDQITIYYKVSDDPEQQIATTEPAATQTLEDDLVDGSGIALQPSFPLRRDVEFHTAESESEGNYRTSSSDGTALRDRYAGLEWRGLTTARKDIVEAFMQGHVEDAFYWTPIALPQAKFVVVGEVVASEISTGVWTVRVDLKEAL